MWNVDTEKMCNQHLLGEHVEMHMFAGTLNKGVSVRGYIEKGLVEIHNIAKRHDEIAKEMLKRNMNHKSPIQKFKKVVAGKVNVQKNAIDLAKRCKECRKKMRK